MTESMTLKRPKPKEDEDELLRMQKEFLESKHKPSVQISHANIQNDSKKMQKTCSSSSLFSANKKLKHCKQYDRNPRDSKDVKTPLVEDNIKIRDIDTQPESGINSYIILGNIVEREVDKKKKFNVKSLNDASSDSWKSGFPSVFTSTEINTNNKSSLFWQKVGNQKILNNYMIETVDHDVSDQPLKTRTANLEEFCGATEEEILQEKQKIESILNPSLIEFLKQKRREKYHLKAAQTCTDVTMKEMSQNSAESSSFSEMSSSNLSTNNKDQRDLPKLVKELFDEAKHKRWVHMDVVEQEKVQWVEDVSGEKEEQSSADKPYNARFDFNGVLLPFKDETLTVEKALHHHGQEPERPGYTLQELLQLSRSSSLQQRCIALQTLTNIIEKSRQGWYDTALDPAPLSALSEKNIFSLLRFSLDESSIAIITASLQALRAFLHNEEDEVCLDRLFGLTDFAEPILKPDMHDVKDPSILKDHELLQLDTIATAVRSDIVARIRFILSEKKPPPDGVSSALKILIRLSRHSHETALNIAWTPNLLDIIVKNFMPLTTDRLVSQEVIDTAYGVPLVSAIRFFRILITYAGKAAADKLFRLEIVRSIVSYISNAAGSHGEILHIESLRLWKLLLLHGLAMDSVSGARLILRSQLMILMEDLNIGQASEWFCEHAIALIAVSSHEESLKPVISQLLRKWSTQLANISSPTWGRTNLVSQTLEAIEDFSEGCFQSNWISNPKIFTDLRSTSNLLSGFVLAIERGHSSLPSLGALTENGQLQPALSNNSCLPFLATSLRVLTKLSRKLEIQTIYSNSEFVRYICDISKFDWSLERSWYTRIEFALLMTIVQTGKLIEEVMSPKVKHAIWLIAVKLVSALSADAPNQAKEMLRYALDPAKLSMEDLLKNLQELSLNENTSCLNLSRDLVTIYESYVAPKGSWDSAAMPKDWLFLPLIATYTAAKLHHNIDKSDTEKIIIVLNLYLGLPELVKNLTPNLRFSRLILVFLCDTVFSDKAVSPLIEKVISEFLRNHYKQLDFTGDVPGLSSFTDMFTSLCENFFSHSFGNRSFSIILLTFTTQRQDSHYRKMLWSEHAGTLRYIRVSIEELIVPLNEFLYPLETDVTLIECYITALVRCTIKKEWCPLPHIVALHHSAMFIKQTSKLATRMRTQLGKLKNSCAANELLNYEPLTA